MLSQSQETRTNITTAQTPLEITMPRRESESSREDDLAMSSIKEKPSSLRSFSPGLTPEDDRV